MAYAGLINLCGILITICQGFVQLFKEREI